MGKAAAIIIFLVIRYLMAANKEKKKNLSTQTSSSEKKKSKNLDDILGDFMKNIEQKKPKHVLVNSDNHSAEEDTHKNIEWQDVETSHIQEKKQLLKHSDYKNISHRNENIIEVDDIYDEIDKEETEEEFEFEEIDLRQAVLYKEILDRKYFTI